MAGRHDTLSRAPLVEAVFELRADTEGSITVLPGKMAVALEADYPEVKETEAARFLAIAPLPPEAGFAATHQFRASDGKGLVQLGPMGLTVNAIAYPGFDAFRAAVSKVLDTYHAHASVVSVRRLGLRYVNRLAPPEDLLLSGLTVSLTWPTIQDASVKSVALRGIFGYSDPKGQLAIAIAAPAQFSAPRQAGRLLDLDFSSEPLCAMTAADILSWVDKAHDRVYQAFRGMVDSKVFESWR
jgi:uncharacterized protein (TIGR04255 family)